MKQVVILGNGASWKEYPKEATEIWGSLTAMLIGGLKDVPFTRLFAFDDISPKIQAALDIAQEKGIPICSNKEFATEKYPLDKVTKEFHTNYFKNTVSYTLALALYEGYTPLLYGFDPTDDVNYNRAKPWITYWLGVAVGRNIGYKLNRATMEWLYRFQGEYDI